MSFRCCTNKDVMMRWPSARNLAQIIINGQLDEMKNFLDIYSPKTLRRIISQKIQGNSLLFIAVNYQRILIVEYLLRFCKSDPNDKGLYNGSCCPCLWLATAQNNREIVTHLLRYGADVDSADVYYRTALYIASYNSNYPIIRYLVANGADLNKADYRGMTCLMVALNNVYICRYLINNGADINLVNNDGKTALMLAIENQNMNSISLLMSHDVDIHFQNQYGESAVFIAAMKGRWDIVESFKRKGLSASHITEAEVYELNSCQQVIRKNPAETILLWKEAVRLRNLSIYTPLFKTDCPSILSNRLDWIRNFFDYITGSTILFMVSRWGLLNPYTLTVLRDAICQTEDLANFVVLYRCFALSLRAADNQLFEKVFVHVYLMSSRFLIEWSDNLGGIEEVFDVFVMQIEDLFRRIHSPQLWPGESFPLVLQIKSYFKLFMDMLKKIHRNFPKSFANFKEGIRTVVNADNHGPHKFSLLHLCIENEYPVTLAQVFLECGANIVSTDERGKTAVHYALQSFLYRTTKAVNMFLEYGFQPEKFKDEYCLPCYMRRNRMLERPVNYITLKCLAAEVVVKQQLSYENRLPVSFQNLIYSHL